MFIAASVVSVLLAAVLLISARGKLTHDPRQMATLKSVGFPEHKAWLLGTAEIAGAFGLVAGLFWWPIGLAAGVGVIAYFTGAVGSHLRIRDWQVTPPGVLLAVGVVALVFRGVTI
jgi:uncharacterized membrane protein YphA (DoxX/SURF4 family)